ncbi:MAG: hypothetical protein LBV12_00295, partial [Puniceicoccales bacterium]|nr:hypothetical protein [Puniceicoccales bacterium]
MGGANIGTGTISGTITGNFDLALTVGNVAGTILALSGNNTYTGKTTISGSGFVSIASTNALGTGQDLVINSGGLYTSNASGLQIQKNNVTIATARLGNATSSGKLTFTGAATVSGTVTTDSVVEFTGAVTAANGFIHGGGTELVMSGGGT